MSVEPGESGESTDPAMTEGPASGEASAVAVGDEVELDIGPVGHGGVCVARLDGRVVFVRYALPGERAVVRITEARPGSFCRGEAIRVLRADPRRVAPPCAHFGPGGCGGCDFQHASGDLQRELKAAVVAEQLERLAGLRRTVVVEPPPGSGWAWRSRVRWAVGAGPAGPQVDGAAEDRVDSTPPAAGRVRIGPRRYRSHDVVPVTAERPCLIAADGLSEAARSAASGGRLPDRADEAVLVRRGGGGPLIAWQRRGRPVNTGGPARPAEVVEQVAGRRFAVRATGFWQAHEHAPAILSDAVRDALAGYDLAGGVAWDLYGGVGLFAAVLADLVGPGGSVVTVESDRAASRLAHRNLRDLRQVRVRPGRVEKVLPTVPDRVDAAVLDPPRTGAGAAVCRSLAARRVPVIVYVACDPAALARDTGTLLAAGYRLESLRAFDLFPQTHHVECVALLTSAGDDRLRSDVRDRGVTGTRAE